MKNQETKTGKSIINFEIKNENTNSIGENENKNVIGKRKHLEHSFAFDEDNDLIEDKINIVYPKSPRSRRGSRLFTKNEFENEFDNLQLKIIDEENLPLKEPNKTEQYEPDISNNLLTSLRFWTTILVMFGITSLMNFRMILSMGLVCMVKQSDHNFFEISNNSLLYFNETNITNTGARFQPNCQNSEMNTIKQNQTEIETGEFLWSKTIQGHVLSSFFYGFIPGNIIGGWACDRWGGRICLIFAVAFNSLCALAIPTSAYIHYTALAIVRFVQGLIQGIGIPVAVYHVSYWSSKSDVSILSALTYTGMTLGVGISLPITSGLCLYGPWGGWPSVFYFTGLAGFFWCIIAYFLLYDSPMTHPLISKEELRFLRIMGSKKFESVQNINKDNEIIASKSNKVPWKKMATDSVVLSYIFTYGCCTFGYVTFAVNQPFFMRDIFSFSIDQNGLISAIPWLVEVPLNIILGILVKWLLGARKISPTLVRKFFTLFGFFLGGVTPIVIVEFPCALRWLAGVLVGLSELGNCIAFVAGFMYAPVDFLPVYAATIFGIAQSFTGISGFVSPIIVSAITTHGTKGEWRIVFWSAGIVYIIGGLTYVIWGSAKPLAWSEVSATDSASTSLLLRKHRDSNQKEYSDDIDKTINEEETPLNLRKLAQKEIRKNSNDVSNLEKMARREALDRSFKSVDPPTFEIEPTVLKRLAKKEAAL